MRNLKKILALVLALVMSMSLVSVAGAYEVKDFADADKIDAEYAEAMTVLSSVGLFAGDEKGNLDPDGTITRAQMATLIYRMLTGDAAGKDVAAYAASDVFTDCKDHWAKGYINYCAGLGIVLGYGDTFAPDETLTGYQAILMMLRAIGWDKQGESTKGDYKALAAAKAQTLGWTVAYKTGLGEKASREMVGQIMFEAMKTVQLSWVPFLGDYFPYSDMQGFNTNETLFAEKYNLHYDEAVYNDQWGRPYHVWFNDLNNNNVYDLAAELAFTVEYAPVYTFVNTMHECDLFVALGLVRDTAMTNLHVNGARELDCIIDEFDGVINATGVKREVGAAGRTTEIYLVTDDNGKSYRYEMVMIDEFMAEVKAVTDATYDKAGHMRDYAKLYITVWYDENTSKSVVLESVENFSDEVKAAKYLLINMEAENTDVNAAVVDRTPVNGVNFDVYDIVGEPVSFKAIQSYYFSNRDAHYVGGKDYDDSARYGIDECGSNNTAEHVWYLDSTGVNVIGVTAIEEEYRYATLTAIKWDDMAGLLKEGCAIGILTYMDGTQSEQLIIASIDKKPLKGIEDLIADYENLGVSSSVQYNKGSFTNQSLYSVEVKDGVAKLTTVNPLAGATTKKGAARLTDDMNATNETLFLVAEKVTDVTYKTYTGIKNVPTYTGGKFWVIDENNDMHAEMVFIVDPDAPAGPSAPQGSTADTYHVWYAEKDATLRVKTVLNTNKEYQYVVSGGMLDGEYADLTVAIDNYALINYLNAHKGEVLRLTQTYKKVAKLAAPVKNVFETVGKNYIVWAKDVATLIEGVLVSENRSYDVEGAKIISYNGIDNLEFQIDYNKDAEFFLVFNFDSKDELNVVTVYVVDEEGETVVVTPPTEDDDEDDKTNDDVITDASEAIKDAATSIKDLLEALKGAGTAALPAKAEDATDIHVKAYLTIVELIDAINEMMDDLNDLEELTNAQKVAIADLEDAVEELEEAAEIAYVAIAEMAVEAALEQAAALSANATAEEIVAAAEKLAAAEDLLGAAAPAAANVYKNDAQAKADFDALADDVNDAEISDETVEDAQEELLADAREAAVTEVETALWNAIVDNDLYKTYKKTLTKALVIADTTTFKWEKANTNMATVYGTLINAITDAEIDEIEDAKEEALDVIEDLAAVFMIAYDADVKADAEAEAEAKKATINIVLTNDEDMRSFDAENLVLTLNDGADDIKNATDVAKYMTINAGEGCALDGAITVKGDKITVKVKGDDTDAGKEKTAATYVITWVVAEDTESDAGTVAMITDGAVIKAWLDAVADEYNALGHDLTKVSKAMCDMYAKDLAALKFTQDGNIVTITGEAFEYAAVEAIANATGGDDYTGTLFLTISAPEGFEDAVSATWNNGAAREVKDGQFMLVWCLNNTTVLGEMIERNVVWTDAAGNTCTTSIVFDLRNFDVAE